MKLPTKITTRHRIRDCKICQLYVDENQTMEEIAVKFQLTRTRISQILYDNRSLLVQEKEWERTKRINWLKRQVKQRGNTKKDPADLVDQIRKETDGDKPTIETHLHITTFRGFLTDAYRGNTKDRADVLPDCSKDTVRLPS